MAEDTVFTLIDIPKSKKETKTEDINETRLSELSISSRAEYQQIILEPLTSIEINSKTGTVEPL